MSKLFVIISTVTSAIELPCDTVEEAQKLLNNPNTRPELLAIGDSIELMSDSWELDDIQLVTG